MHQQVYSRDILGYNFKESSKTGVHFLKHGPTGLSPIFPAWHLLKAFHDLILISLSRPTPTPSSLQLIHTAGPQIPNPENY